MQVVGGEEPPVLMQILHCWCEGALRGEHIHLFGQFISLAQVAGRAGGDHVFPCRRPTFGAGDDVIECQILVAAAILARESIPQKHIKPREGGRACGFHIGLEADDGG